MKCLVINLTSSSARREYMTRHLAEIGVPFEFVAAVDGRSLSASELEKNYDRHRALRCRNDLTLPEVGASLSHLKCYRRMVDENIPRALILEDDAKLKPETLTVTDELSRQYPADREMLILLTHVPRYLRRGMKAVDGVHSVVKFYGNTACAHGYFITNAAARRMLRQLWPVWLVADHWNEFLSHRIVPVRALVPCVIGLSEISRDSTIGGKRAESLPSNRKTVRRFCRRYLNLQLPAYLFRRARFLLGRLRVWVFDEIITQPCDF
ncbi:MAG: glycosyltransferase family 25 protein [Verrucomicrobiales bacterium]|nr:glycosyltransferase family 25 protein [Verrucomicrobiales bacterium]